MRHKYEKYTERLIKTIMLAALCIGSYLLAIVCVGFAQGMLLVMKDKYNSN